jgi:phosphoglycerate dehydrogenase-like enzyme
MKMPTFSDNARFRVGLSADFLDEDRQLVFPDIGLDLLEKQPGLAYHFIADYCPEYTPAQIAGYDVLISLKPRVTAKSLAGIDRLCAIGRCGVGYDNVDLEACTESDIAVYITPQGVIRPVAESIVLFVLALSHNLVRKDRLMREGRWVESTRILGNEPRDKVIGSVGFGGIARDAFRLLQVFNPSRLIAVDPYLSPDAIRNAGAEPVSIEDVFSLSDYVLINCPLTMQTRKLVGHDLLSRMKPNAFLINTARGPIIDQTALIAILEQGRIAGAALDVFESEPLSPDSPLAKLDNVILTSHSVGWTRELFRDMGRVDCEGALAVMRGEAPQNVVNRDVLDRPCFRRKLQQYRDQTL